MSAVDFLALTSSDQLLFILKNIFLFLKTNYFNEEVNNTEHAPSVRVPWKSVFVFTLAFPDSSSRCK